MAKQKKRGFFSWLGFGEKEQETEQKTEEQQAVEEQSPPETPVETAAVVDAEETAHSKEEVESFAEEVVEVTEQVQESEKPEPVVVDDITEAPQAVIEHEELPLPEEVKAEEVSAEEWQAEAETVEIVEAVEEEAALEPELTDEELEAQALAAEAAEEAVIVVPVEEEPEEEIVQEQEKPTKEGFFARLKRSLLKTKENLGSGFISLFRGKKIDDDLFEELEEQLLIADVGVETTRKIIANLTEGASRKQLRDAEALYGLLKDEMGEILAKVDEPLNIEGKTPFVILMVGVNGVGKTTTIGKLARQFEQQGKSVMLAAGDTFRAAAVEQLQVWGQRNNIPVIAQHTGADSASVIFDAIQAAKARNVDVLIADTAGRLQNKSHLMEELKKIVRVMKKLDEDAPHEIMLTIDASTGQNAISQAKLFTEAVGLTGIALTKLDGTAKGGVIFSVADQFGIPIRYIGVGERIEDLRPFKADDFIEALFARED
ncbi:signal recognition particle-docking protein FtsY [Enterobacter pseudoroggenkampii]|uniref:Signal recognition particle receptor FtsY n=1 Tax=Enterobacter pseudoroggenkampii TaxID=2996112 RepID=A0ABT3XKW4_9ENTR|nr:MULTISPECIES: signal recognition particle-docking protein FtsY [Enterobacter]MCK4231040.1 signal recognition particle-docking protein FtsY [Enterobacter asburiae]MCK6907339.1 signal recognition particle-docking protein FtsY [Enterobacter roggenkampii]KAE8272982.1 signal recognition particle-docking protein FtsY [Enterobacter sp. C6]MCX8291518.1 signal recognition particle-docking protein FtsY [Enterobacter pseudoroggenkampii]MCX8305558.1 signal recognition particle-docking protein FtsY [Ent